MMFVAIKNRVLRGMIALVLVLPLGLSVLAANNADRAAPAPGTRVQALDVLSRQLAAKASSRQTPLYFELLNKLTGPQAALNSDPSVEIIGVVNSQPRFYTTNNLFAAQSIGTDHLWPGGATGLDLDGGNLPGELAIWDAGRVMDTHQEFTGRVAFQDDAATFHYHATHVGGTLIAAGIAPLAKGMSYAGYLDSYNWSYDESEMATAAANGLLVSNHSYGYVAGWLYNSTSEAWYWYGNTSISPVEDAGFGIYDVDVQAWDQIAYDAPNYLIVKSAGNDRNDFGPGDGGEHFVWQGDWVLSTDTRNIDGHPDGFDTIPFKGNAKNILTVGAVYDVAGGWTGSNDVVMSTFSGWGPTDDGRVKPDVVANGLGLYSCYVDSNTSYAGFSGTSMAAPNASGSLHLLVQHWRATHSGQTARAATIKALAIHTADEAGLYAGPDYSFGWGLLNVARAGLLIADDASTGGRVYENSLAQGMRDTIVVYSDGSQPLSATICWLDPATKVMPPGLDQTTTMLVNDLDIRLQRVSDAVTFFPWLLDPANPTAPPVNWDNTRDNVEKVEIPNVPPAYYRVIVGHKNTLTYGPQEYSLVISGAVLPPMPPSVANVIFEQRADGSGLVDVTYDLDSQVAPSLTIGLEASTDGGTNWDLLVSTISGDIGTGVTPGLGKSIIWDFAADNPQMFGATVVLRVTATE